MCYDILRAIRRVIKHSDLTVFFEDLIYFIIISPVTFCLLLALTNGELRAYIFAALTLGFVLTRITLSVLVLKVYVFFFSLAARIFSAANRGFYRVFDFLYAKFTAVGEFLRKIIKKIPKSIKKLLKKR